MTERPDGYDALPKRFKDYIQKMESQVNTLRAAQPSQVRTSVKVVDRTYAGNDGYLPDDTRISFAIGVDEFEVFKSRDGDGVEVHAHNGGLSIEPNVSNVVTIVARKR